MRNPPWAAVASPQLANLLGVHLNSLWTWKMRGTSPEPEPNRIYRNVGNRVLYRWERTLAWLPGGDRRPAWWWAREWIHFWGEDYVAPDPREVLRLIPKYDAPGTATRKRRWLPRNHDALMARLRAAYGCRTG